MLSAWLKNSREQHASSPGPCTLLRETDKINRRLLSVPCVEEKQQSEDIEDADLVRVIKEGFWGDNI